MVKSFDGTAPPQTDLLHIARQRQAGRPDLCGSRSRDGGRGVPAGVHADQDESALASAPA